MVSTLQCELPHYSGNSGDRGKVNKETGGDPHIQKKISDLHSQASLLKREI